MATGANSSTRRALLGLAACVLSFSGCTHKPPSREPPGRPLIEIETSLRPIAQPLAAPEPGDWLSAHKEDGQTFAQYFQLRPKRRGSELTTIYLLLLGSFSPEQREILETTQQYLGVFFQSPVKMLRELPLDVVPEDGRRIHPTWDTPQIQTSYVLDQLLRPERPSDALAYLCFTSSDLCSHATENYVLGEARTWDRIGVWSIYRNGNPAESPEAFRKCLRRTMHIATHETGHILALKHCIAFQCNMNGANSPSETDRHPLHFCPVCLRKLLWNLDAKPDAHLADLEQFCRAHQFDEESTWYVAARSRNGTEQRRGTRKPD